MRTITVPLGSNTVQIQCEDEEKVTRLAKLINSRIADIKERIPSISDSKAVFFIALTLQDEIEALRTEISRSNNSSAEPAGELYQLNDYLMEVIGYIAAYLEKLTLKLNSVEEPHDELHATNNEQQFS